MDMAGKILFHLPAGKDSTIGKQPNVTTTTTILIIIPASIEEGNLSQVLSEGKEIEDRTVLYMGVKPLL